MNSYALILLAAGPSNRMGQPKQILPYKGKTLLENMMQAACASCCKPVVLVLGAHSETMMGLIDNGQVTAVQNPAWEEGMASSIRCGLAALADKQGSLSGVILMVCDQPFVSSNLLNELIQEKEKTGKTIVACAYNNTVGTPALFDSVFFPELMKLQGSEGAKKIILQQEGIVATIPFPMGYLDIDTIQDYEKLDSISNK